MIMLITRSQTRLLSPAFKPPSIAVLGSGGAMPFMISLMRLMCPITPDRTRSATFSTYLNMVPREIAPPFPSALLMIAGHLTMLLLLTRLSTLLRKSSVCPTYSGFKLTADYRSQNVSAVTTHYVGGPWGCKEITARCFKRVLTFEYQITIVQN